AVRLARAEWAGERGAARHAREILRGRADVQVLPGQVAREGRQRAEAEIGGHQQHARILLGETAQRTYEDVSHGLVASTNTLCGMRSDRSSGSGSGIVVVPAGIPPGSRHPAPPTTSPLHFPSYIHS